jgi:hypothetical protein
MKGRTDMKLTAFAAALVLHGIALFGLDTTLREGTQSAQLATPEPARIVITARRGDPLAESASRTYLTAPGQI